MKTRIMFYLVWALLFVFAGNSFAMEAEEPQKIDEEYSETIGPQGAEGYLNTWYGQGAGANLSTGQWNSFFGINAGKLNTKGNGNSFFGESAGESNTEGHYNSFFGYRAGKLNTEGNYNSFFGRNTGYSNTIGYENSFFGQSAGSLNTTGFNNSFFGKDAGHYSTTGFNNSFFGTEAGESNTTGHQNSFFGKDAGESNTTGHYNSFFGVAAGDSNSTGWRNSFFGYRAGFSNLEGSKNVFLGYQAGYYETGSEKLYIDNSSTGQPLIWGDFEANNVVIYGGFRSIASYSSSDGRWKKNIEPLESSLDKISNLQGVSYEWKIGEYPDFGLNEGKQIGLVAQDVEQVLPELVSESKDGYKAVSYSKLTAVLVEAVKELKGKIEEQRNLSKKQQTEIEELRALIKELKT